MLYLIRYAEIGSETHLNKSKLRSDIAKQIREKIKGPVIRFGPGRTLLETDDTKADAILSKLHGITSYSPAVKCPVSKLDDAFLDFSLDRLKGKTRFAVKVKRVGSHRFTSQQLAARLSMLLLDRVPGSKVDLKDPDKSIFVEVRKAECYIFDRIIPGIDHMRRKDRPVVRTEIRLIADDMLGKLARRLRMMGFDIAYPRVSADSLLLRRSRDEKRVILTRDRQLTMIKGANALLIHSTRLDEQLKEAIKALGIKITPDQMFSRCAICNSRLTVIGKEEAKPLVPPFIYDTFDNFTYCPVCDKVYWKGTHYEKMLSDLKGIL